jgi:hypothetical protein
VLGDRELPGPVERIRADVDPDLKSLPLHTDVLDGFLRHLAAILHEDTLQMVDLSDQPESLIYAGTLPNPLAGARGDRAGHRMLRDCPAWVIAC